MRFLKNTILVLLVVLIVMQFFHPDQNYPQIVPVKNIGAIYTVPENVSNIITRSCNDCHSNYTRYRWYNTIEPLGWWLESHVRDGKRALNFDEFGFYRISKQYDRLQDIIDEVKHGDMPLTSYALVHRHARLKDQDKVLLINWAEAVRDTIKLKYPADSLVRRK